MNSALSFLIPSHYPAAWNEKSRTTPTHLREKWENQKGLTSLYLPLSLCSVKAFLIWSKLVIGIHIVRGSCLSWPCGSGGRKKDSIFNQSASQCYKYLCPVYSTKYSEFCFDNWTAVCFITVNTFSLMNYSPDKSLNIKNKRKLLRQNLESKLCQAIFILLQYWKLQTIRYNQHKMQLK